MPGIEGLRTALEALPLRIDDVGVQFTRVALGSYPDGPRPTSTVTLAGRGLGGIGEHVGWTDDAHHAFGSAARGVARGSWRLGQWRARLDGLPAYDRAALEAAAIDLALRQNGTSLLGLAGVAARPVRYVVSFARVTDPVAEAESLARGDVECKIDADPAWPDETWQALAARGRIAVVDFKLSGEVADHERACRHLPGAWIEDPRPGAIAWSEGLVSRLAADAAVTSIAALEALAPRPAAVNVKPARMGSVLEAIACLAHCKLRGLATYIGGMFEVGIARRQLLVLATLACPDGPNDIAPLPGEGPRPPRLVVDADATGFAGDLAP